MKHKQTVCFDFDSKVIDFNFLQKGVKFYGLNMFQVILSIFFTYAFIL